MAGDSALRLWDARRIERAAMSPFPVKSQQRVAKIRTERDAKVTRIAVLWHAGEIQIVLGCANERLHILDLSPYHHRQ